MSTFSEAQYNEQFSVLNDKINSVKVDLDLIQNEINNRLAASTTHEFDTKELFDKYLALIQLKSEELSVL